MNCKQDDLAMIVKSYSGNNGKIVNCKKLVMFGFFVGSERNSWVTEPSVKNSFGITVPVPDDFLRPLRDNPGQDETLTWAPVPKKVEA